MVERPNNDADEPSIRRRNLLTAGGLSMAAAVAGCFDNTDTESPTDQSPTARERTPLSNAASNLFVAPDGDGDGSAESPFGSIEEARAAVSEMDLSTMDGPVAVNIEPGEYFLDEPVAFEVADSGTKSSPIVYRSTGEPGSATISGGVELTDWEPVEEVAGVSAPAEADIYRTDVSDYTITTLFEDDTRAIRARQPNRSADDSGLTYTDAPYYLSIEQPGQPVNSLRYANEDIDPDSFTADQAEVVIWPGGTNDWIKEILPIESIDAGSQTITFQRNASYPSWGNWQDRTGGSRFYLQNAPEFLDEPGEYFYDSENDTLYYYPRSGDPTESTIVAPITDSFLQLHGDGYETPIHDIRFDGLRFEHTSFVQNYTQGRYQAKKTDTAAAAETSYAERVELTNCHFRNIGLTAIDFQECVGNVRIEGCHMEHIGRYGFLAFGPEDPQREDLNKDNIFRNNYIHDVGELLRGQAFNLQQPRNNEVSNSVFHGSNRGLFTYNGEETKTDKFTTGNVFKNLQLYETSNDGGDNGAIAPSDTPHENTIENVTIEGVYAHPSVRDVPPNGIFMDQGIKNQTYRNVWISRTAGPPWRANGSTPEEHTFENASWREGFDPQAMEMDAIGVNDDFYWKDEVQSHLPAPTGLTVEENGDEVSLSWDPTMYASEYTVYRRPDKPEEPPGVGDFFREVPSNFEAVGTVSEPAYSEAKESQDFYYTVVASDGSGTSGAPIQNSLARVPKGLTGRKTEGVVSLQWEEVETAASYTIYRATQSGGSYEMVAEGIQSNRFEDESFQPDTDYYYVVTSTTDGGLESNYSAEAAVLESYATFSTHGDTGFQVGDDGTLTINTHGQLWGNQGMHAVIYKPGGADVDAVVETKIVKHEDVHYRSGGGIIFKNRMSSTDDDEADGVALFVRHPKSWTQNRDVLFLKEGPKEEGSGIEWNMQAEEGQTLNQDTSPPWWLKVEKAGTSFTGYAKTSADGSWKEVTTIEQADAADIQDVGVFMQTGSDDKMGETVFEYLNIE